MGFPIFLGLASGCVALLAGLVIILVTCRSKNRMLYGVIGFFLTGAIVFAILLFNAQAILDGHTHLGFGVSAEEANQHLFAFKVPPEATNVNYRRNIFLGTSDVADFTVDEKSFLAWVKKNGWHAQRFITEDRKKELEQNGQPVVLDGAIPCTVRSFPLLSDTTRSYVDQSSDESIEIHSGYTCSTYDFSGDNSDCGKFISYDLDHSRAYITSSTR